jgi:hypothetical protein
MKYFLFLSLIYVCLLFSNDIYGGERTALSGHRRNLSYQSFSSGGAQLEEEETLRQRRSPTAFSLNELWKLEHESLQRDQVAKNRAALWASGQLDDSQIQSNDLKLADYYELQEIINRTYPVGSVVKAGFNFGLLGACCTIFVAGTENDITELIQMPSVVNQAAYGGAYGGGGLALFSFLLAGKNAWIKRKKFTQLIKAMPSSPDENV